MFFEKHLKVEYLEGINEESLNGKLCRRRKCFGGYDDGGRVLKRRERGLWRRQGERKRGK